MTRILLSSVAAAAVLASAPGASAQTEIQWWHAMGGNLGETVNEIAAGFNKTQTRIQGRAGLQGLLHRDPDRRDRRLPRQAGAAHRAGVRGRHRQHDGGQGRGLSGLPADGRRQGAVRSQGVHRARSTATTRRPTASFSRCRSTPRRRCSTGTRSCSRRRGSIPTSRRRPGRRSARWPRRLVAAGAKCGFTPQWQTWTLIENYGAWHNLPFATKANGFGGTDIELKFNDAPRVKLIQMLADWSKDKRFVYGGREGKSTALFTSGDCGMPHRLVGHGLGASTRRSAPTRSASP